MNDAKNLLDIRIAQQNINFAEIYVLQQYDENKYVEPTKEKEQNMLTAVLLVSDIEIKFFTTSFDCFGTHSMQ